MPPPVMALRGRRRRAPPAALLALLLAAGAFASDAEERRERREAFAELGAIRDWTERAWSAAYTYKTAHYFVRTNTSMGVARYIARLMEMTAARYREIFGYAGHLPRFPIHAYATYEEFNRIAAGGRLPPGVGGFFTTAEGGAIHLPYIQMGRHDPTVTLFHEGTHQFVRETIDFRVPLSQRARVPQPLQVLASVPLWLNEGLATYMESARYDGEEIEEGRINPSRLGLLQNLLRQGQCPSVASVVSHPYGKPFDVRDYAVAWGLVYALRHDWRVEKRDENRRRLVAYIEACRRAFYGVPSTEFGKEFLADDRLPADFEARWHARIGGKSLEAFRAIIVDGDGTLEAWEAEWAGRIRELRADQPYGGTRRGAAARDRGELRLH